MCLVGALLRPRALAGGYGVGFVLCRFANNTSATARAGVRCWWLLVLYCGAVFAAECLLRVLYALPRHDGVLPPSQMHGALAATLDVLGLGRYAR